MFPGVLHDRVADDLITVGEKTLRHLLDDAQYRLSLEIAEVDVVGGTSQVGPS